jgi:mRNA-degrading endonuclease RelE of RelBE toxin-antitoxin system
MNYGQVLMPSEKAISVRFTPEFKRNLRQLSKKYRHIRSDIQPIVEEIQAGNIIGDQIPRINYTLFKVRVKNSDIRKGKRSGYRFIYYLKTETDVVLVTIYSKLDQSDISAEQVRQILREYNVKS